MVKTNSKKNIKKNKNFTRKSNKILLPKMSYIKMIINELQNQQQSNLMNFTSERNLLNLIADKYRVSKHLKQRKKFFHKSLDILENEKNMIQRKKCSIRLRNKTFKKIKISSIKSKKIGKKRITEQSNKTKTNISKLVKNTKKTKNTKNPTKQTSTQTKRNLFANTLSLSASSLLAPVTEKVEKHYEKRWPAVWQFYDDNNFNARVKRADGWYDYDTEASDVVEDEWQRYIVNRGMNDVRAVKSGEWQYMVDFVNWKQTNIIHQNHKQRSIRRLDENGKVSKNPYQ